MNDYKVGVCHDVMAEVINNLDEWRKKARSKKQKYEIDLTPNRWVVDLALQNDWRVAKQMIIDDYCNRSKLPPKIEADDELKEFVYRLTAGWFTQYEDYPEELSDRFLKKAGIKDWNLSLEADFAYIEYKAKLY